jgi:hypothetical protein
MKSTEFTCQIAKGLRKFGDLTTATDELCECYNLAPQAMGLELHEIIGEVTGYPAYLMKETGAYLITETGKRIKLL